jgi:microsomal dipeptidase-like Zn-dependent dipeptidase
MFADLHCHPHMRSYLCLSRDKEKWEKEGKYHPWTIIATNMSRLKNVDRAAGYAQSDMVALWNGKVRLVFNSLYPIETGFFMTPDQPSEGKFQALRKFARVATHHKAPIRPLMQHLTMRIPTKMIKHVCSPEYDYWEALQEEYQYLCSKNGVHSVNEVHTYGVPRKYFENPERRRTRYPEQYHAEGVYQIPVNNKEVHEIAAKGEDVIMMPLTIEGGHVFGAMELDEKTVLDRIDYIKKEWQHPLFFLTFSHHFNNGLCGHAHSLPEAAAFVLNQDDAMNAGFTPLGMKVLRKLLAINENNDRVDSEGYRVLIDLKHMSAAGRKEYYEQVVNPCFEKGDVIPVIGSHCAYAARKTLDELIEKQANEDDTFRLTTEDGSFYAWNINLCDEDIEMIYKTGGLFGLSFDKRMLGVSPKKREEKSEKLNNINALWNNLRIVLNIIYRNPKYSASEKRKAWDMLAIGTDNDGYIDPISDYKTANELQQFKTDLLTVIQKEAATKSSPCVSDFDTDFTPELVVDKICYNNALDFVMKHYPNK